MARQMTIQMTDDIDGSPDASTVRFGLDGLSYEIDLSADNAESLREVFRPYTENARRTGGRRERGTGPAARANGTTKGASRAPVPVFSAAEPVSTYAARGRSKAIRAWAASKGIELSPRGRIPKHVAEEYDAAEDEPIEDEAPRPRRGGRRKRA